VLLATPAAFAAGSFDISGASSTAQTLGTGQTGTVESTGTLSVSGGTVAVTVNGNNATINNLGTMTQTGTGRVIRDNTGVQSLVVNNGSPSNSSALMQAADGDVIQMNVANSSATLNNYGRMVSLNASAGGSQAVDFSAMTGANTINNYAGGLMKAMEADAVRPGANGVVYNAGTILSVTTTGSSSDGVDGQSNSGIQVTNDTTGLIEGGRHGITMGAASNTVNFTAAITNNLGGVIQGDNGSGINIDGFNAREVVTVLNHGTITGNGSTGDGDGIDVDGLVNITNTGVIRSINAVASGEVAQSEGITVGGGTITNSGLIEGDVALGNTNAVGRGITLAGIDTTVNGNPAQEPIYGNSVVNNLNGGTIKGQNDSAIVVSGAASGFTVTINNNAGASIVGGSVTQAAIRTGADADTIVNSGLINGSSSGKAIDLGGGNNTLKVVGGSASILGDVSGGAGGTNAMSISAGAGNSFSYSGSLSNFATVEVLDGEVTLSGVSTYTGTTLLSGGTLLLSGANRLAAASGLQLNGGKLQLANPGGKNAQTFSSLALTGNSVLDLDFSSLTFEALGSIGADKTLTVLDWSADTSPDYAFRIFGNETGNDSFLSLINGTTIDGLAATFTFDGQYTDVKAVPIPAPLGLLLCGLAMMGIVGRRREGQLSGI
jgi:hypothetical protein